MRAISTAAFISTIFLTTTVALGQTHQKDSITEKLHYIDTTIFLNLPVAHRQTATNSDTTFNLIILKGNKDTVYSEANKFSKRHSDIKTSIEFIQPYFVLFIGTCSDINKTKQLKELLKPEYPNSQIEKCKDK